MVFRKTGISWLKNKYIWVLTLFVNTEQLLTIKFLRTMDEYPILKIIIDYYVTGYWFGLPILIDAAGIKLSKH